MAEMLLKTLFSHFPDEKGYIDFFRNIRFMVAIT